MSPIRVQTPSRLHFGLLGWGPGLPRQFGGVGLMIDDPGLDLEVEPADRWHAEGPLAGRALGIARGIAGQLAAHGTIIPPLSIAVRKAPPEHVGLGTGTQLSLAIARAALEIAGRPPLPASRIAELTGRGMRSGIGLHGFERGGLLVDGGRGRNGGPPPLVARLDVPHHWHILLAIPPLPAGLHGRQEVEAFRGLRPTPSSLTDRLCRLILLQLLPAVAEADLPTFGAALTQIQEHVGRSFAPAQGGVPFAHPRLAEIASHLARAGLHGVGQSSWGPTLYGFSDEPRARFGALLGDLRASYDLEPGDLIWTRPCNRGTRITCAGEDAPG